MAGSTINGSTGNEYIDAKIVWSSTPNTSTNKSSVTAALYYKRNNTGFTTYGTGTFSITINGTKTSATKTLTITAFSSLVLPPFRLNRSAGPLLYSYCPPGRAHLSHWA